MPDKVDYAIFNIPLQGQNLAASRTPRLQPSVPAEFAEMLSGEVSRGGWTVDPANGEPLDIAVRTLPEHLEFMISTRAHWLMPAALEDDADATWTSGNITKQGVRLRQLEQLTNGSKAAALVMLTEEAARYGVKPFTTEIGVKPGEAPKDDKKNETANLTSNPWSARFNGDEAQRTARIASIIKTKGTKLAENLAKAAGTTVGRPLRK